MSAVAVGALAFSAGAFIGVCLSVTPKLGHRLGSRRHLRSLARPLHELRGALTAIQLGVSLIERGAAGASRVSERVAALHPQLARARLALEELQGAPRREEARRSTAVELRSLVLRRARAWSVLAPGYGARLRCDWQAGEVWVRGDSEALTRALDNLIANALEHGGGRVLIEGERAGALARVSISDGGPGAPHPDQVTAAAPGSPRGHGLAIVRDAIESQGGRLVPRARSAGRALALELRLADLRAPRIEAHPSEAVLFSSCDRADDRATRAA